MVSGVRKNYLLRIDHEVHEITHEKLGMQLHCNKLVWIDLANIHKKFEANLCRGLKEVEMCLS